MDAGDVEFCQSVAPTSIPDDFSAIARAKRHLVAIEEKNPNPLSDTVADGALESNFLPQPPNVDISSESSHVPDENITHAYLLSIGIYTQPSPKPPSAERASY